MARYEEFVTRQLTRTHWSNNIETMYEPFAARSAWIEARREYLAEQYRLALNEADNIIGKQWSYDNRPASSKLAG